MRVVAHTTSTTRVYEHEQGRYDGHAVRVEIRKPIPVRKEPEQITRASNSDHMRPQD
jgi:hypothetical protein